MTGTLRPWVPVGVWAAVILLATSIPFPVEPVESPLPVDKAVHLLLYAGLGRSGGRGLSETGRGGRPALVAAWAAGIAFAALDEAHQLWIPGRDPSAADWAADAVGMGIGIVWGAAGGRGEERSAAAGREATDGGEDPREGSR